MTFMIVQDSSMEPMSRFRYASRLVTRKLCCKKEMDDDEEYVTIFNILENGKYPEGHTTTIMFSSENA